MRHAMGALLKGTTAVALPLPRGEGWREGSGSYVGTLRSFRGWSLKPSTRYESKSRCPHPNPPSNGHRASRQIPKPEARKASTAVRHAEVLQ
ncbi:hypothetical protein H6CHR_04903 [Variovorax sp. PBL-H6]|nr:hypothetical protein H6CHR_04903 [Variovorax sp. PBL-H6]